MRKALRYLLLAICLFLWIIGGILLGLGIWLMSTGALKQTLAITMVVLGAFKFAYGFTGCWACLSLQKTMVLLTILLVGIVALTDCALGIVVAVNSNKVGSFIADNWHAAGEKIRKQIEIELNCCGCHGNITELSQFGIGSYQDNPCFDSIDAYGSTSPKGCCDEIKSILNKYLPAEICAAILIILLQAVVVVLAWRLSSSLKEASVTDRSRDDAPVVSDIRSRSMSLDSSMTDHTSRSHTPVFRQDSQYSTNNVTSYTFQPRKPVVRSSRRLSTNSNCRGSTHSEPFSYGPHGGVSLPIYENTPGSPLRYQSVSGRDVQQVW